jgi:quercetin dioxygenase-like cupin family protein
MCLILGLASTPARAQQGVIYIPNDKAAPIIRRGGSLISQPNYSVASNRRAGPGQVEVHDRDTDTFYILEGEATFVVGGTMVGGKVTAPNQQRGKSINGGTTYQLRKGDVIAIPAGTPHWFKAVPREVLYYTVKVTKP